MKQYLDLLQDILENGTAQANRTGIDAISLPGAMMKFDLQEGFPAVTTKKLYFRAVVAELLGFIRGYSNAADFRKLGCKIWDDNANSEGKPGFPNAWLTNPNRKGEDDLGRIYGVQWRSWRGKTSLHRRDTMPLGQVPANAVGYFHDDMNSGVVAMPNEFDQLAWAVNQIQTNPTNRRIIVNAWRPDEFDQMALPPCHVMFQFLVNVEKNELNLCMYQRSCDTALGVPFNIASYALLLHLVARATGLTPRFFTHFLADAHIYINHVDGVMEQLSRDPKELPNLVFGVEPDETGIEYLEQIEPDAIDLGGYLHHPAIHFEMAV